jgi:hypothetical protein
MRSSRDQKRFQHQFNATRAHCSLKLLLRLEIHHGFLHVLPADPLSHQRTASAWKIVVPMIKIKTGRFFVRLLKTGAIQSEMVARCTGVHCMEFSGLCVVCVFENWCCNA